MKLVKLTPYTTLKPKVRSSGQISVLQNFSHVVWWLAWGRDSVLCVRSKGCEVTRRYVGKPD